MEIVITVKILNVQDRTAETEPSLDDVVEFVKTLNTIQGVTVVVE